MVGIELDQRAMRVLAQKVPGATVPGLNGFVCKDRCISIVEAAVLHR